MPRPLSVSTAQLRSFREQTLYRLLFRTLRSENQEMIRRLRGRGHDVQPSYPSLLANLDTEGTRISALAARAGVTRQAAGQLLRDIERHGYVRRGSDPNDARAILVTFTAKGHRLLANALDV